MEIEADDFLEEEELPFEEADLRILKGITTELRLGLEFAADPNSVELLSGPSRVVGRHICHYLTQFKTTPTLRVLLDSATTEDLRDQLTEVWDQLEQLEFDKSEFQYDVEKLRQRYVNLGMMELREFISEDQLTLEALAAKIEHIKEVRQPGKRLFNRNDFGSYVDQFQSDYLTQVKNPDQAKGIHTGFSYFDYITNGLRPADLLLIGGETGSGKSLMLNNMALNMWQQKNTIFTPESDFSKGYNVLYFSLEMNFKGCFRRSMAKLADVPSYGLRDATLSKSELEAVAQVGKFAKRYPYRFEIIDVPRGLSVEGLEQLYLMCCSEFIPDVIIVDYLGLLEDKSIQADDWLKLGLITGKLHEFGRAYEVPILTAVQLNRVSGKKKNLEEEERIGLHRFGRSSLMATHATTCIQIETRSDEKLRSDFIYHIIKNRDGEMGKHSINKKLSHMALYDVPYEPEIRQMTEGMEYGFKPADDISDQIAEIYGLKT